MLESTRLLETLPTLHPREADLTLGRMLRVCQALGDVHKKLPRIFHVAGTNGKGSTTAFLRAVLEAHGRRVHTYTSPHLVNWHERIRLADDAGVSHSVTEDKLVQALHRIEQVYQEGEITPFELLTAAAFLLFSDTPADDLILEVGLGGRLDATNVIETPYMTLITPVSFDHVHLLGDTLALIAREKAGILKRGVPCVVAGQKPSALEAIKQQAQRLHVPLSLAQQDFMGREEQGRFVYEDEFGLLDLPLPALAGSHQLENAALALAALRWHGDFLDEPACVKGMQQVVWPARLQRIKHGPLVDAAPLHSELWLDGAHNEAGAVVAAAFMMQQEERVSRPLHLIVGMLNTKDAAAFFKPFVGVAAQVTLVTIRDEPKAIKASELAVIAREAGLPAVPEVSVLEAVKKLRGTETAPRILLCGSLYFAGTILQDYVSSPALAP